MKPLSKKAIYAATIRKFAKAMILIADELEEDEAPKLPPGNATASMVDFEKRYDKFFGRKGGKA
jgi:hypothetical protein